MVVAQAVRTARGKTQVIGDQARKRPKDLFDMHQYVREIPTMPTGLADELDLGADCQTFGARCRNPRSCMTVDPPQPARIDYHQLPWPTRPFPNNCDARHLQRAHADTHHQL